MTDRYLKFLLVFIAINLTAIVALLTLDMFVAEARAGSDEILNVHVVGGTLDYASVETQRLGPILLCKNL